jgi:hypothetical protein
VLLALDNDLLESVDELLPSLLGESVSEDVLGLLDSVIDLLSVLLGDSVLELLGLASGLVLGLTLAGDIVSVVGLSLGRLSLLVGLAGNLVLLFREGSVGVSGVVEVLSVRLQGLLSVTLGLFLLLLSFLLLLLSLVVCLTGRSGVALGVLDPA